MNKHRTKVTYQESYDAICDKCGATIATDCTSFNDVVFKSATGTNFNGDRNYTCANCNQRRR